MTTTTQLEAMFLKYEASCNINLGSMRNSTELDGKSLISLHKLMSAMHYSNKDMARQELIRVLHDQDVIQVLRNVQRYPVSCSPLHHCIRKGFLDFAECLILAGANIEVQELNSNVKPIHLAVVSGYDALVELLISYGVDLKTVAALKADGNWYAGVPLLMASFKGNVKISELLEKCSGEIAVENIKKLYWSAINSKLEDLKEEKNKGDHIWRVIHKLQEKLRNYKRSSPQYTQIQSRTLELEWKMENLQQHTDYRPKERLAQLQNQIECLQNLLNKATSAIDADISYPSAVCPVCMELPKKEIYNCQRCDNMVCGACKEGVMSASKKCPSCRQPLDIKPLVENKLAHRIICGLIQ